MIPNTIFDSKELLEFVKNLCVCVCELCEANPYRNFCIQRWLLIVWHQVVGKNWAKIGHVVRNRWLVRLWVPLMAALCRLQGWEHRCVPGKVFPAARLGGAKERGLPHRAISSNCSVQKPLFRQYQNSSERQPRCAWDYVFTVTCPLSWNHGMLWGGRELRAVPPSATGRDAFHWFKPFQPGCEHFQNCQEN